MLWNRAPINVQIDEYVRIKSKNSPIAGELDKEWLEKFVKFSGVKSVEEINLEQILRFREKVWSQGSKYPMESASRAIRCFLRYFKARRYVCISPVMIEKV
jgi:hypothetical protein